MNFDDLKDAIAARIEALEDGAREDIDLAANTIAVALGEAVLTADRESAEEMVDQLELLGEIQRLRLRAESIGALRDSLKFAIAFAFSLIPT